MKKVILLLLSGMLLGGTCLAQNGYTISGKIRGISISKAFLVAADFGSADTLASTAVEGDKFMFSGTVPGGVLDTRRIEYKSDGNQCHHQKSNEL